MSGPISPLSSATGMNWSGGIIPCVGWGQRSSASMVAIPPVRRSICGW